MRIAIDVMGGDHAPKAPILGVLAAIKTFPEISFTLVGDENKIKPYISNDERISILHTEEVIEPDDEPVRAVRRKKNASMVLAATEVREGRADACISAGNTGALMATGLFRVGRLQGIDRPALAPTLPTLDGKGFLLLDAGANMDAKPIHLLHYAIMGSIYIEQVRKIDSPKIGLLNVGTEEGKGNELSKATFDLLKTAPIHFVGNIEARDLLNGVADVVIADGFSGNLVLKTLEGTGASLLSLLKSELTSSFVAKIAALFLKRSLLGIKQKMDYSEYGGAALFGLKAPVVKAHGSSNETAILHTIRQTKEMVERNIILQVKEKIKELNLDELE
ncbi:phosphate acyltransferase PlsX [Pueribacillus sp. YX66]|uniref:phosphate acyltransferase PlsX n=1 Tax=Pueribacillus sp. YX66 TaxID=3229242 RepID=UPI00358CF54C